MQHTFLRTLFGVGALMSGLAWFTLLALGMPDLDGPRRPLLLAYFCLLLLCLAGLRMSPQRAKQAMLPMVLGTLLLIGAAGWASGWGVQVPGLLFFGLLVFVVHALGSRRAASATLLLALAVLAGLGGAELAGWLPGPNGVAHLLRRLLAASAAVGTGALLGRIFARLLAGHLQAAAARERRFSALLGMATSAYWETDAHLRLRQISRRSVNGRFEPAPVALGGLLWDLPRLALDAAGMAALRADTAARRPLRDLPLCWQEAHGLQRHFLGSAEPHLDPQGSFLGYWGVAREVTNEHLARQALARSQALLDRVVSLSPDIITVSDVRSGRYVMVNHSFERLLGYSEADLLGKTALSLGLWHNPADRVSLLQAIQVHGAVQDRLIQFVTRHGQVVPVLLSGTRFDSEGQSYLLLNGRDMSEATRVRLEREAILANASVGIAFTRDRRFVLANAQFERMFGWPTGTLVGQPGRAVWADDGDYDALGREVGPALLRGEGVDVERTGLRRDSSQFLMRLRAKAIDPADPGASGTIWIAEDVTGTRQAEQDLARARDAAEAASRAKSAFLANTSHEIRTPLNGVLGLARLARQPGLDSSRRQQYLDQIVDSADVLAATLSDILDVAKIEAGKLVLETAPFDLHALLRSLQLGFAALAEQAGLQLAVQIDPALPTWVRGDALRVRQILANFLHNALKFTASGSIRLVVLVLPDQPGQASPARHANTVRMEVHDTGPGIDAATQARLFEPFTQADTSTTRRYGGSGLGLSICRELAQLMGGTVGLISAAGLGSCFHAELPLPALPLHAAQAAQAAQAASVAPADDSQRLHGARVLLVEDNAVNMLIGSALLAQWGVQVTEAADGGQALAAVAQEAAAGRRFDAVLMDLQMPGMSGFEATALLRRQYKPSQLPVIALTAAALVSERSQAEAIGMTDFLSKPVDPQRLRAALLRALDAANDAVKQASA